MENSKLLFSDHNILVYQHVFLVNGTRYPIKDINGAFVATQANYRKFPITCGIFNLIGGAIFSIWFEGFGLFLFLVAAVFFIYAVGMKTKYTLRLKIGMGEVQPVISTNKQEIENIRNAILQAIAIQQEDL